MKFVIRRAVVGVIASPIVASAYVFGYAVLVGLGSPASVNVSEAWHNGWLIAGVVAFIFAGYSKFDKLVGKVVGE